MRNSIKILGKTLPVWAIVTIALAGVASATLLTYYGTITATANVQQSVLLDGQDITGTQATDTLSGALGGETFCYAHSLKNQASVPAKVNFAEACSGSLYPYDCDGVTTMYLTSLGYSFSQNFCNLPGSLGVTVQEQTVGDAKWLVWTYTFAETPTTLPKMTVAINYPSGYAITTFDDGSHNGWYYAPDGGAEVKFAEYIGGSYGGWVTTSVSGANGNVLTVSIKESALPDSFHWHGYGNYNGNQVWIGNTSAGANACDQGLWTYGSPHFEVTLRDALSNPVTVQSGQTLAFSSCYSFEINIAPATYTVITSVNPA